MTVAVDTGQTMATPGRYFVGGGLSGAYGDRGGLAQGVVGDHPLDSAEEPPQFNVNKAMPDGRKDTDEDLNEIAPQFHWKSQESGSTLPSACGPNMKLRFDGAQGNECSHESLRLDAQLDDHFEVGRLLGEGNYGRVYEVVSKLDGQKYAMKSVEVPETKTGEDVELEIEILAGLNHPHILKLHRFFRVKPGSEYHMILDLIPGGSLIEYLCATIEEYRQFLITFDSGFSDAQTSRFLWQMLTGLAYVHHHGFIHRDVKLDNYLVSDRSEKSNLKLCDFGFATRIRKKDRLARYVGTPAYCAPEVSTQSYHQAADVWSLGVSAFVMCTGHYPFGGVPWDALEETYAYNVRVGEIKDDDRWWTQHQPRVKALVISMLELDPDKRPTMKHLLQRNQWLKRFGGGGKECCAVC